MKTHNGILVMIFFLLLVSCNNEDDGNPASSQEFSYNFATGTEGWTGDFTDYPPGEEEFYELIFSHAPLPEPMDVSKSALMLSGNNHSDDLFMFVKKEITGLVPNREYFINFKIEFATNVANNQFGIGGSPGESVYLKVGATSIEPTKQINIEGFYALNIDKNNQSQSGTDMIVVGNFSNGTDENIYTLKTLSNTTPFKATTNSQGTLWIITGTDSGFEGKTTIFFNHIEVTLN